MHSLPFTLLLLSAFAFASAEEHPNVLIVMTDDQGLGDFSLTGNPILKTPHFDAFARQSLRLTDFHVTPMCSPTRGQLLTGLAALRNGACSVTAGRTFLRSDLLTLPQVFSRAGYATGIFGKWHLGDMYPHRPIDRGFQESAYHLGWGQLHSTPEFARPLENGRYFHNAIEKRFTGHCTDWWFEQAKAWIADQAKMGRPFLCYIPTNAPHAPHLDAAKYADPYRESAKETAEFFGMIAHCDQRFGDLMAFLNERKLERETIVVFMTDNGGTGGLRIHNAGLRAGKTTYYEGGHRVPCWIRKLDGSLGEPREIAIPAQNTDLFPTLCRLCGVPVPEFAPADRIFSGDDLTPLLSANVTSADREAAEARLTRRKFVVQYGQNPTKFDSCVVENQWRLVKGTELYDVVNDRAQSTDLASRHPEKVRELREYYESWWSAAEPWVNRLVPISLGAKEQPVVELNSGDWEGIYADNVFFVREAVGGERGGHWNVVIETAGEYEFTLRRWPEITGTSLGGDYRNPGVIFGKRGEKPAKTFPAIAGGSLKIGAFDLAANADSMQTHVVLKTRLSAGPAKLQAWFTDSANQPLCGAFFVTVKKLP